MTAPDVAPPGTGWTLSSGGAHLHVFQAGRTDAAAPVVLLVHGYPDDHRVFDPLVQALCPFARVVSYDTRVAGLSSVDDPALASYRLPLLADDLFAVADSVGAAGKIHLVGHDWGSVQSWEAMRDPRAAEVFASFLSVSGPSVDHLRVWNAAHLTDPRSWPTIAGQLGRSWYVFGFALPGVRRLVPRVFRWAGRSELAGRDLRDDPERGGLLYRANVLQRMLAGPDPRCEVPTTLVVPTGDRFLSPRLAEDVDTWVRDLTVVRVDAGHWWPRTRPEQVATLVRARFNKEDG